MYSALDRPIALVLLDGWGVPRAVPGNAIYHARTPYFDELSSRFPSTEISTAGAEPGDAGGNSETGHMTIGAGRMVQSDASRVAQAITTGEIFENQVLRSALANAAKSRLHLVGLFSDGDIHASPETLYTLLRMARRSGVHDAFVHCILDGTDVPPRTADIYVEALEIKMADIGLGRIATLCGRFFAMDTGENWERTARAVTMLTLADGERFSDARAAIRASFLRGISDEFISPIVLEGRTGEPVARIEDGDVVIFFNHRADGMRQLAGSLAAKPNFETLCLTDYDAGSDLAIAFPPAGAKSSVTSLLDERQINNYRISDADRFAHVTKFFNGGATIGTHEFRIPVPTVRDAETEMSSFKTADKARRAIESDPAGVFIITLSAVDQIAENGDFARTVEAVQYVDTCLGGILEKIRDARGIAIVTSTHANSRITAGTDVNVPFYLIDEASPNVTLRAGGSLEDVGVTLLALAGIPAPTEMTGRDLRMT